jgi:hypothetical protein
MRQRRGDGDELKPPKNKEEEDESPDDDDDKTKTTTSQTSTSVRLSISNWGKFSYIYIDINDTAPTACYSNSLVTPSTTTGNKILAATPIFNHPIRYNTFRSDTHYTLREIPRLHIRCYQNFNLLYLSNLAACEINFCSFAESTILELDACHNSNYYSDFKSDRAARDKRHLDVKLFEPISDRERN